MATQKCTQSADAAGHAADLAGTRNATNGDFADRRVIVVPGEDQYKVTYDQGFDGPAFLRVGSGCTNEYLADLWRNRQRFPNLSLESLIEARNSALMLRHSNEAAGSTGAVSAH